MSNRLIILGILVCLTSCKDKERFNKVDIKSFEEKSASCIAKRSNSATPKNKGNYILDLKCGTKNFQIEVVKYLKSSFEIDSQLCERNSENNGYFCENALTSFFQDTITINKIAGNCYFTFGKGNWKLIISESDSCYKSLSQSESPK